MNPPDRDLFSDGRESNQNWIESGGRRRRDEDDDDDDEIRGAKYNLEREGEREFLVAEEGLEMTK